MLNTMDTMAGVLDDVITPNPNMHFFPRGVGKEKNNQQPPDRAGIRRYRYRASTKTIPRSGTTTLEDSTMRSTKENTRTEI
jgi:hypothetical protein